MIAMQKLTKHRRTAFWWGLILSVLLVLSIPAIPLVAVFDLLYLLPLPLLGIMAGMIAMPLVWIHFASLCSMRRTLIAVQEGITEVNALSLHRGLNTQTVAAQLRQGIDRRYLTGYYFDGSRLTPIRPAAPRVFTVICPQCGATAEISEKKRCCAYCRMPLPLPENE